MIFLDGDREMAAVIVASPKKLPRFKTLHDVTPEAVDALFMPSEDPTSKHPVLVIAIGSPGVGKTSSLIHILNNDPLLQKRGITYDHFYNLSLDTIVEHVQPYRNLTRKAYKYAKDGYNAINTTTKQSLGLPEDFHNKLYAPFANLYTTVISKKGNNTFGLQNAEPKLYTKINTELKQLQTPVKDADSTPVDEEPFTMVGKEFKCNYCGKLFKTQAHFTSGTYLKNRGYQKGGTINNVFQQVLQEGMQKSYHMIYDTTFGPNTNKMDLIMGLLANVPVKYKIIVIHITATEEEIQRRIRQRHLKMIDEGYLRAIKLSLVSHFIKDNANGYDAVKTAYQDPKYVDTFLTKNGEHYTVNDFTFINIINHDKNTGKMLEIKYNSPTTSPTKKSPTRKSPTRKSPTRKSPTTSPNRKSPPKPANVP